MKVMGIRWVLAVVSALVLGMGAGLQTAHGAAVAGIYWTASGGSAGAGLWRSDLDGSNATRLVTITSSNMEDLNVTNDYLYYAERDSGIFRADLDGSNVTQMMVTTGSFVKGISVTDDFVYWLQRTGANYSVRRSDLDGSNAIDLFTGTGDQIEDVEVTDSFIYWSHHNQGADRLLRADLDGSNMVGITTNATTGISILADTIYNTGGTIGGQFIQRQDLDGSNLTTLASRGFNGIGGISATEDHLYWTESQVNRLVRSNLDGSGVTNLFQFPTSGVNQQNPGWIDVVTVPEPSRVLLGMIGLVAVVLRRRR